MISSTTRADRQNELPPVLPNPRCSGSPMLPPSLSEIVDFSEDALSQPRSGSASQKHPKQICGVSRNPWEVLNEALTNFCHECWQGPGDCEADGSCELYPIRNWRLRERVSADEMRATIRRECRQCLGGTSNIDECASPNCYIFSFR